MPITLIRVPPSFILACSYIVSLHSVSLLSYHFSNFHIHCPYDFSLISFILILAPFASASYDPFSSLMFLIEVLFTDDANDDQNFPVRYSH